MLLNAKRKTKIIK